MSQPTFLTLTGRLAAPPERKTTGDAVVYREIYDPLTEGTYERPVFRTAKSYTKLVVAVEMVTGEDETEVRYVHVYDFLPDSVTESRRCFTGDLVDIAGLMRERAYTTPDGRNGSALQMVVGKHGCGTVKLRERSRRHERRLRQRANAWFGDLQQQYPALAAMS